jgi:hypothetical protein
MIDRNKNVELEVTDIHPEDGLYQYKNDICGKKFKAFLTTTSVGHPGWYMVAGTFEEQTGVAFLDQATTEDPIVISMAKYVL